MGDKPSRLAGEAPKEAKEAKEANGKDGKDGKDGLEASVSEEEEVPSEGEILARLLHSLGQVPGQSLPLAKILSKLPAQLRSKADAESVCAWLQRFPGILEVSGPKGQEYVMLTVGKLPQAQGQGQAGQQAQEKSGPAPPGPVPTGTSEAEAQRPDRAEAREAAKSANAVIGDDDNLNPSSVQLRGLPFRATIADVQHFLGDHVKYLSPVKDNVRLLSNRDGRPSGFARVFFVSPQAAHKCRDALHKKQMGDRYIEVLACADRRGRRKVEDFVKEPALAAVAMDASTEHEQKERVLQECREHMSVPGRQQILLSMLGIALSEPARAYLRRANLGLKHFLARFPLEFQVDGPKGCEKVVWMRSEEMVNEMAMLGPEAHWAFPGHAHSEEPQTPDRRTVSPSAKPASAHSHFNLATPSDWGTPAPHAHNPHNPHNPMPVLDFENFGGVGFPNYTGTPAQQEPMPLVDFSEFQPGGCSWPSYSWPQFPHWGPCGPCGMPWAGDVGPPKGPKKPKATDGSGAASLRSHAHLHPQAHPFASRTAPVEEPEGKEGKDGVDDKSGVAALRLRGLPFSVTVQDVLAFFAQHDVADLIHDGPGSAHLLPKANGRPSGQAVVQMRSRKDAETAQQALNHQWVGQRYIEVFVYGEEEELKDTKDFNEI